MLTITLNNASQAQILKATPDEREYIKNVLSYYQYVVLPQYNYKPTQVKISELKYNKFFGTGLIDLVTRELDKDGIDYEVWTNDFDQLGRLEYIEEVSFDGIQLEDYQKQVLKKLEKKNRGIIVSPTGSGKTIIIAGIVKKFNYPKTFVVVPTQDIAMNTVETLKKLLKQDIGIYSSNYKKMERITVILYQSLSRLNKKELNKNTDLIIIDEADVATDQIQKILTEFPDVNYRYGLTATPPSLSNKKKAYLKMAGQIGERIVTITDKKASKRLADVEAYMFEKDFKIFKGTFEEIYRPQILLSKERANHLLKMVFWAFSEKKVKSCLMLVDELEQAKLIKEVWKEKWYKKILVSPYLAHGKLHIDELIGIKKDLNNKAISFVIATPVFSRGTDIPNVDCICIGSVRKSLSNTLQKIGRGRRKTENKKTMVLLDSYDIGKYVSKYSETRRNLYKAKRWLKDTIKEF